MLLPFKNWLLNVLVSLVEFERVILIVVLLGSTSAGQEIIYPVGGRWLVGRCLQSVVGGFTITPSYTWSKEIIIFIIIILFLYSHRYTVYCIFVFSGTTASKIEDENKRVHMTEKVSFFDESVPVQWNKCSTPKSKLSTSINN